MMRIVQVYETDDGKTFGNRTLARQHEVTVEALNKLVELLASSVRTGRPDAILRQLLVEAPEVSTILMSYRKKFPKMESEAA